MIADFSDAVRDSNTGQAGAIVECSTADPDDSIAFRGCHGDNDFSHLILVCMFAESDDITATVIHAGKE